MHGFSALDKRTTPRTGGRNDASFKLFGVALEEMLLPSYLLIGVDVLEEALTRPPLGVATTAEPCADVLRLPRLPCGELCTISGCDNSRDDEAKLGGKLRRGNTAGGRPGAWHLLTE